MTEPGIHLSRSDNLTLPDPEKTVTTIFALMRGLRGRHLACVRDEAIHQMMERDRAEHGAIGGEGVS